MNINGFTLVNEDKLDRAIHGSVMEKGQRLGGVGEDATKEEIIAEYDKLGGLIREGKYKVKMGSFYDFENRKARKEPKIVYELASIDGGTIEVEKGTAIPIEAQAAEVQAEKRAKKAAESDEDEDDSPKKTAKSKAKKAASDDSDEE